MPATLILVPLAELALPLILGPVANDLYEKSAGKLREALEREPLAKPLRRALDEAGSAFVRSLEVSFDLRPQERSDLKGIMQDESFVRAVAELPFRPFGEIDTSEPRRLFETLGPAGSDASDFDAAWQSLGRRFQRTVAKSEDLTGLLELVLLAAGVDSSRRSTELLAKIEDHLAAIRSREEAGLTGDAAIDEYRGWFYRRYQFADTRGLFMREKERPGEGIELREVFVETLLRPVARPERRREIEEAKAETETEGRLRSDLDELEALGLAEDSEAAISWSGEPRTLADLLTESGKAPRGEAPVVVLGPPGSGKSTLLRALGMAISEPEARQGLLDPGGLAERVPVLLELKRYASRLANDPGHELLPFLLESVEGELPGLEGLLRDGRALVLLDGLDEVFDERHRRWVSEQVWELVTRYPRTRFVLSSRPHGYAAAPLPGPVARCQILPFDEDRIRQFFRGWFTALAREGLDPGATGAPEARADELTAEVQSRPKIREMAENPLLCTLIVLVHRARTGRLPQRRVHFFDAAARTLAERWEEAKRSPEQPHEYDFPEPELILKALEEVAWRAFHELERREIPETELRKWLEEVLAEDPEWTGARGRRAVDDFLKMVRERTGLLVEAGGERYQFVHLNLHEYLAAQFILDRLDEETSIRVLLHYLHAPEWEEVLRLTVASAGQARTEPFLRAILSRDRDEVDAIAENGLRRDLRFVCRCLSDGVVVHPDLREWIRTQVVEALDSPELQTGETLEAEGLEAGFTDDILVRLRLRLDDDEPLVRSRAVDFFVQTGADDPETRHAVRERLDDDDPGVRESAVDFFSRTGADDPETRVAIRERLDDDDPGVRSRAVDFFSRTAPDDPETRVAVRERLDDDDPGVRSSAVEFFARTKADDPETRQAFRERLTDDHPDVRSGAVYLFTRTRADDPETHHAVRERLTDDDPFVRRNAVEFFARTRADDPETHHAVRERLTDDDPFVRSSAVKFFARTGADDPETLHVFRERLTDDNPFVREGAVDFFARTAPDDPETRHAVRERLDDDDPFVREGAVDFFARTAPDDIETRNAFRQQLADHNPLVRRSAVDFFARTAGADPDLVDQLGVALRDRDQEVRISALWFFATHELPSSLAARVLATFEELSSEISGETDRRLAEAFGRFAATDPQVRARILDRDKPIPHLSINTVLDAMALERDRLRRAAEPLEIPFR